MQKAGVIRNLKLDGDHMVPWQLREVVSALQFAARHMSPANEFTIPSGDSPYQQACHVLTACHPGHVHHCVSASCLIESCCT